jgi:acetyl esterase
VSTETQDRAGPGVTQWWSAIREISASLPDLGAPDLTRLRPAARVLADAVAERFTLPVAPECRIDELRAGPLRIVRYRSGGPGPRGAQLVLHGGGWMIGSVDEQVNRRILSRRAVASGVDVLDVEYRLAPEHPFPAGLDDALAALYWLVDNAPALGIDPARIGIGGSSAGGNLAALVAQRAPHLLALQVLEVPAADLDITADASFDEYGDLENFGDLSNLRLLYLGTDDPAVVAAASPGRTADLTGLPPALVLTAELDPLRDAGERYARRLADAGVAVTHHRAAGLPHGGPGLTAVNPEARHWQDLVADHLRRHLTVENR